MIWGFVGAGDIFMKSPLTCMNSDSGGGHSAVPHLEIKFSIYDGALKYFFSDQSSLNQIMSMV